MAELELKLRKALPEADVRRLLEEADWGQGRELAHITQQIEGSDLVFSVWEARKLCGFARVITDSSYLAAVLDFIVAKSHQGQGVGKRLMEAVLAHPDLAGVRKWVVFSPMNKEFFEQFNFEKSDEAMVRYG